MSVALTGIHSVVSSKMKSAPVQSRLNDVDKSVGNGTCEREMIARETFRVKSMVPRPESAKRIPSDGRVRESVLNCTALALPPRAGANGESRNEGGE